MPQSTISTDFCSRSYMHGSLERGNTEEKKYREVQETVWINSQTIFSIVFLFFSILLRK